jgi:hypothetical protein
VLIGAALRFLPLGASTFPLNDGGLFARMAHDVVANGFLLPAFTSYNGEAIPFAYPPLGLYLTAISAQVLGRDAADILRWLPAALSTASVFALYLMAAELLRSRWRGLVAAAAFAVMPRSYVWLVVGGGITRALGLLLALLALHQGILMLRRHRPAYVAGTAAFGGLTALAHPQAAVFLAVSLLTLLVFHAFGGRAAASLGRMALAGVGALLIAFPWLFAVITMHGLPTLLAAARTGFDPGSGADQLLGLAFADSPVLDLLTALGVLGVMVRIARRQWMVPTWLLLTIFIDPRAGATYATVPLALSVVPILGEILSRMVPVQRKSTVAASSTTPAQLWRYPAAAILALLVLFVALRTASRTAVSEIYPLHGLQPDHVAAMAWISRNEGEDATFAVVTGRAWESDYLSEWFPVLANRISVATVQGSEWTGIDSFLERLAMDRQLQDCATRTKTCIASWVSGWDQEGAHLFLPKGQLFGPSSPTDCCPALRETLAASADFRVIYDGPGATIFAPANN